MVSLLPLVIALALVIAGVFTVVMVLMTVQGMQEMSSQRQVAIEECTAINSIPCDAGAGECVRCFV